VGAERAGRRLLGLQPLGRCRGLAVRDYLASTRYWGGGTARGTFAAASDYAFRPLSTTGIRALLDGVAARTSGPAGGVGVLLDSYGGAIRRTPPGGSAFPHRRALFSFQEITSWAPGGPHLRPYVSGAAYLNYIDPEQPNPQQAYYGASLRRLQAVKRRYDPRSVFRFAEGIRPR
jgi:hypothetical protein